MNHLIQKMNIKASILCIFLINSLGYSIFAQQPESEALTDDEIEFLIYSIADSLEYYYVDVEMGKQIGNQLLDNLEKGNYAYIDSPEDFATQITTDLRSLNGDLHLFLEYHPHHEEEQQEENFDRAIDQGISSNYGIQELQFIKGNIAYLKINHFSNWSFASKARQRISEIMSLLSNSKAFIIDLKDNRGGVPFIASFLASYFFGDEPVHLADFYTRFNDYRYGIYTEPLIPGVKHIKKPLFILVNDKSASAAEEFAFWLQNQKRATIIGKPTAGAGYGAMNHQLNDRFSISISSEEEIDPITKKGFQGTGVVPDIIAEDSSSLTIAITLAESALEPATMMDSTLLKDFYQYLEMENELINESLVYEQTLLLHNLDLLTYNDIYDLGIRYQNESKKAIPIFRANTVLYSFYPNPFIDYAEALISVKDYEEALKNYL